MQHGARSRGIDSVPTESTGTGTPQNQALRCGIVPSFPPSTLESKQCLLAEGGGAGVEERGAGLADGHTRWSGNLNRYQIKSPDPLFSPLGHEAVHVEEAGILLSTDQAIWNYAVANAQTIITKDEDF